jgi:hypothetical protein
LDIEGIVAESRRRILEKERERKDFVLVPLESTSQFVILPYFHRNDDVRSYYELLRD